MTNMIGLLYHPRLPEAHTLSDALTEVLQSKGFDVWSASAWQEEAVLPFYADTSALVAIGGDGTILRAARSLIPTAIPIIGIRYGRLGFLAEIPPEDAVIQVPVLLSEQIEREERTMLQATCSPSVLDPKVMQEHHPLLSSAPQLHALNDVVIARGAVGRPITVDVAIDGQAFTSYRCDAVILSTATGSTGYALATGGSILNPVSQSYMMVPVSPHATMGNPLVLEPSSITELTVHSDHGAFLSIDGQIDVPLPDGARVTVQRSPYRASFLRAEPQHRFYAQLLRRLHFGDQLDP